MNCKHEIRWTWSTILASMFILFATLHAQEPPSDDNMYWKPLIRQISDTELPKDGILLIGLKKRQLPDDAKITELITSLAQNNQVDTASPVNTIPRQLSCPTSDDKAYDILSKVCTSSCQGMNCICDVVEQEGSLIPNSTTTPPRKSVKRTVGTAASSYTPTTRKTRVIVTCKNAKDIPQEYDITDRLMDEYLKENAELKQLQTRRESELLIRIAPDDDDSKFKQRVENVLEELQKHGWIQYVDYNIPFQSSDSLHTQIAPPNWGLDRIDQRSTQLDNMYLYNETGAGVNIYIVDTGVLTTHVDFGGRADQSYNGVPEDGDGDCNGHGTHVAGIAGSTTYGVAKEANIHAIKVLQCDGSGDTASVVGGLNWVIANHQKPAIASLSLGGGPSNSVDNAVQSLIAAGVTVVVAAGNSNADSCQSSPARLLNALTVAAATKNSQKASFSNYGLCVDLFAPGELILSTANTGNAATKTSSGTSMAAPHVAGVAALYLEKHPNATPGEVAGAILASSSVNALTGNLGDPYTPNRLLFSGVTSSSDSQVRTACSGLKTVECEQYNNTISQAITLSPIRVADSRFEPNGAFYTVTEEEARIGIHRGWLSSPDNIDIDLELYFWDTTLGGRWRAVSASTGPTSNESVAYSGSAGAYIWRIYSNEGSGEYVFHMERPSVEQGGEEVSAGGRLLPSVWL